MHDLMDEGDGEETEKINVVPLADLTLVLLIILMVLSPMISQSMIRVTAPQIQGSAPAESGMSESSLPVLISIAADHYRFNHEPVSDLPMLMDRIRGAIQTGADRSVIVMADDGVFVGRVVEVLDGARQVGAQDVSLVRGLTEK